MSHQGTRGTKFYQDGPGLTVDRITHDVIGAAIEELSNLGSGFLESVYEGALCDELGIRDLRCDRQKTVALSYKGKAVGEGRLDLLVSGSVVAELKTVEALAPIQTARMMSYLRLSGIRLGLLINFNVPAPKDGIKRIAV